MCARKWHTNKKPRETKRERNIIDTHVYTNKYIKHNGT